MNSPPRIDWRIASAITAFLIVLWVLQQWFAPLLNRDLDVPSSFLLQGITWGLWLLLLPLIVRRALHHPLEGRPTTLWVVRYLVEGTGFVILYATIFGALRWFVGLSTVPSLSASILYNNTLAFSSNFLRYSAIYLAYQAFVYHAAVRERDRHAARLELDLARATLANVEARLQPHFLFNTLNAIAALVRDDPRAAETMIGRLSDLLRASLNSDPLRQVSLAEELALAEQYLEIERVRFQDRLRVAVEVSDEAKHGLVPHLMLQPLVENAIRHGIAPLERGGVLVIRAERQNGRLRISVADDGVGLGRSDKTAGAGIGLGALRTRLAHLYGMEQSLDVSARVPRGTVVTIQLPYRNGSA